MSKMVKEKVRQHYVPQFYLKFFSPIKNGNYVYCFDKKSKKSFKTNVRRLCYEIGFYEVANKPRKPIEGAFNNQETECSKIFKKVINTEDMRVLTMAELAEFLGFLVVFKQRTKKRREIVTQARKIWLDKVNSQFSDWEVVMNSDNWQQTDHLFSMVDLREEEMKQLLKNNWILVVNQTKIPFLTSDDPLIQQLISRDKRFSEPYVKYYFPLTPQILIFSEPLIGNNVRCQKVVTTDENIVKSANCLTYKNALRFVISKDNCF